MYFYHGYALGVASTILGKEFTEAACALSLRGGKACATKSAAKPPAGIIFKSADSHITGTMVARSGFYTWVTEASVVIQELDIFGRFTAGKIEAHILSEFRAGDYEASTVIAGSKFEDLRIDGNQLQIETSEDLSERYPTYSSMQTAFMNQSSREYVLACLVGRGVKKEDLPSADPRDNLRAAFEAYCEQDKLPNLKSTVICSLVKRVANLPVGCRNWGPIISVPQFGTIYLGELIVWPWMRCLNLFRIELTSGGTISAGSAGTNGTGFPPGAYGGDGWP